MYKLAFCMEKRWNRAFWWVWSLKNMLQGPGCAFLRIVLLFIWNFICTPDNNTCAKKMVDYAVDVFGSQLRCEPWCHECGEGAPVVCWWNPATKKPPGIFIKLRLKWNTYHINGCRICFNSIWVPYLQRFSWQIFVIQIGHASVRHVRPHETCKLSRRWLRGRSKSLWISTLRASILSRRAPEQMWADVVREKPAERTQIPSSFLFFLSTRIRKDVFYEALSTVTVT